MGGDGSEVGGDAGCTCQSQETDDEVAQCGQGLRAVAGPDLGTVFVEGDVADMVKGVFDCPMATVCGQESLGWSFFRAEAGDAVGGFDGGPVGLGVVDLAADDEALADVGDADAFHQPGGGPDGTGFEATVAFVGGLELGWGRIEVEIGDVVQDTGLVVLDGEQEVSLLLLDQEGGGFFGCAGHRR